MSKKKEKKPSAGPFEALRALRDDLEARAPKDASGPPVQKPAEKPTAPVAAATSPGDDDSLLMARMFAGVEPLGQGRERVPRHRVSSDPGTDRVDRARRVAEDIRQETDAVHAHLRALVEGRARFEVADDGSRVEGRRLDLPMDALRRLRRGSLPVDGRLDMHGMSVQQARAQLELFLKTMRIRGERCVLVIHGKGDHSPQGAGILRGEIAAWLSQGGASEHVAAFATARETDGGEGAVYVLLRR